MKSRKLLIGLCCILLESVDYGRCLATSDATQEKNDTGVAAVIEANKIKQSPPSASPTTDSASIKNQLRSKLREAKIQTNWEEKKQRFGGVAVFTFRVDPNLDLEEYFIFRQTAALGAMLTAQIDVATWLGADASMDVSLKDPGNPAFAGEVNASAKKEVEQSIYELQRQAALLEVKVNQNVELTSSDRFVIATDAVIKKLDEGYDPKKSSEEKTQKLEDFKKKRGDALAAIKVLEKRLETYQRAYSKAVGSGIELQYDHVIFGLSAVAWGENLAPNGTLTIGLAYVWSPKLAKSVQAALTGELESEADNIKGTESLESWVSKQDLASIGAFRYFVDDQGDRWFIGTGIAPNSLDRADQYARLQALQNLYMPLYSRLKGKQQHKTMVRAGQRESDLPAKAASTLIEDLESFAKANTRGAAQATAEDLIWPAKITKSGDSSSASVAVCVYALNAKSAAAALAGNVQMAIAASAVEHENNRRRLEQAQLLGMVDKSKGETPASRVPALVNKVNKPSASGSQKPAVSTNKEPSAGQLSPTPGSKVTQGKLQDDF
jgi:hypothetical protein